MTADAKVSLFLFVLLGAAIFAYAVRMRLSGQAHFVRIDQQGDSRFLGKSVMEMGYWAMQPLARLLVGCRVTANQISWASLGFGALTACFLAVGHFGVGSACALVAVVLDALDGMVARMTASASNAGEVLDAALDRYVEFFFLAALVIYYRAYPSLQALTLFALLGSFMVSYSTAKAEALGVRPPSGIMRRPERVVYLIVGAALSGVFGFSASGSMAYPMVAAVGFVALASNISAINRFRTVIASVRQRDTIVD